MHDNRNVNACRTPAPIPLHVTLPPHLDRSSAAEVTLPPSGRAVHLDGLDARTFTHGGAYALACHLHGRTVTFFAVPADIERVLRYYMLRVARDAA